MTKAEIETRIGNIIDRADRRFLANEISDARHDNIERVMGLLRADLIKDAVEA